MENPAGCVGPEKPSIGQRLVHAGARREARRAPEELPGLELADVEPRRRDGEAEVWGQGHGAAGVGFATEFRATRVVLAVFQPDLDPVSAIAAHDQEIRPDAEPVVAPGLPLQGISPS